ncbi:TAXI family TRAP transporter solute-binding subunit [Citreimonas salinaria]|uniref:TRAP transporter solute receptor, TAXI family n=1 Tax=Citreimonas salinaria TaxID=321339 RepID=A0A1H3KW54_9RHOB|nr:TAXI family TRAP transporter solute-binding subunit [Citreimonas salinaria]SDY56246.1 hypothetical protein SAMN05444340_110140 [Citreimonas salinaria]
MRNVIAAAALGLGLAASGASAQAVGIATSNPGSLFHNIGTAVANAANAAGLNTTIQPATSPNQYLPYVNSGGIEFGVANLQEVSYGITGDAWWNGVQNDDIRVVGMLMPLVEAVFVRDDSGIRSLEDLVGQTITYGYTAQNTILPQYDAIFATAGLTADQFEHVSVPSVVGGANAFMAGEADAFIFAHGAGKVREADAAVGGLYALPVGASDDAALAAAREHWPTATFQELEAGSMPGVTEDATYIAFPQVVFTHAGVSDDVVYQMAKAMYENAGVMAETFPPFRAFRPEAMKGDPGAAEFHPGALKFFDEVGLE